MPVCGAGSRAVWQYDFKKLRKKRISGRPDRADYDGTIWALAEQIKKGDFVPAGFEVSFSAIDNLKAMKISLSEDEELHLKGRIDRLDLCEDEHHVYVKIIDYKDQEIPA